MHDAAFVGEVQRQQQLRDDPDDLAEVEARLAIQVFAQARALDVLHGDERVELVLAVFVHADDVRVQQPSGRSRLILESRHDLRGEVGIDQILAHGLDGDNPFDALIERLVHDPHRALAEDAVDHVLADSFRLFCHINLAR